MQLAQTGEVIRAALTAHLQGSMQAAREGTEKPVVFGHPTHLATSRPQVARALLPQPEQQALHGVQITDEAIFALQAPLIEASRTYDRHLYAPDVDASPPQLVQVPGDPPQQRCAGAEALAVEAPTLALDVSRTLTAQARGALER